jgi:hypothetical protein
MLRKGELNEVMKLMNMEWLFKRNFNTGLLYLNSSNKLSGI